ncbi:hypothetical protein BV20DRAFT_1058215 [Pilatotrama ljubarskyi]|nr:hypothetical protein BV20DRAFT_1058215 [Pilatotrama ljubarskyi]
MSDNTNNAPSDPGSAPRSTDSSSNPDTNASDPASQAPDASHSSSLSPDSSSQPDPGSQGTPPGDASDTPGDQNSSSASAQDGDSGIVTVLPPSLSASPSVAPESYPSPTLFTNAQQPSVFPTSLADGGGSPNKVTSALGGKSDEQTMTIIVASSVSGGVAIVLAIIVIILVYRRRNNRRRDTMFVNAVTAPKRRGSDSTWIGPPANVSFDNDKLEAGNRNSDASMDSETTTLADFAAARTKSGAFSTPSHTPRPSVEKIKMQVEPMIPSDPFEKPSLAIVEQPRPSLDQVAARPVAAPRREKSATPATIQVNSASTFERAVQVEQGYKAGPLSPGSPMLPLVTPLGPPPGWRGSTVQMEYMRAPTRRDSMISLSRQSSRASSRNSAALEPDDTVQNGGNVSMAKTFSSVLARKRRSRGDSIDPFRKSSATMTPRRKSRAESIASARYNASSAPGNRRKSRAESIAPPMTPRRRSQAAMSNAQNMIFSAPVNSMPAAVGLPRTPCTPTAPRHSRIAEPRTPAARTPVAAAPRTPATASVPPPRTPTTAREPRTPRTLGGHPRMTNAGVPRTPTSWDDAVPWNEASLPPVPTPAPRSRPLPSAPASARAELRSSQLSRSLSEVSSKESPI